MKPTKAQQLNGTIGKTARQVDLIDQACGFYFPKFDALRAEHDAHIAETHERFRTFSQRVKWVIFGT